MTDTSHAQLRALDDRIFSPTGWFAIDANNQRVPRVSVSSLTAGLELVGRGRVSTIVGRLAGGFVAVDVDLSGQTGHAVSENLAGWCHRRGLWHLLRPSGGADGRHHLIVAVTSPKDLEELQRAVDDLRETYECPSASSIDVRTTLRPLSAPHRRTGETAKPYGRLRELLARCPQPAADSPTTPLPRRRAPVEALAPRPRRVGSLPPEWQEYLASGTLPTLGGQDHTRSTYEAVATGHMVRAGWSQDAAWAAIVSAHPTAMHRARQSHRRWVQWVWNPAVRDHQAPPPRQLSPELVAALSYARHQIAALAWQAPPRQRATLLLVAHHLIDRMARQGTRRVPCAERDLVLDTGLASRRPIRAALRRLNGVLGTLHTDALRPEDPLTAFEFEIPAAPSGGLSQMSPPSFHTPSSTPPAGTWAALPRAAHQLWRALHGAEGLALEELAQAGHITTDPHQTPTTSQLRTTRAAAEALGRAGLAVCDPDGRWSLLVDAAFSPEQERHDHDAHRAHSELAAQVAAERRAWRTHANTRWSVQRAAALKRNAARERAWWRNLSPQRRTERQAHWAAEFDRLALDHQHELKHRLALRRQRAGVDEADRYRDWLSSLTPEELTRRSVERARRFEALPQELQAKSVALWNEHRSRWSLPHSSNVLTLPQVDTRPTREARAVRSEQLTLLEDVG